MAIALVANTAAGSSDNGYNVTTAGINTTGATLLVVVSSSYTGGSDPTITDSKSNTWTPLTVRTNGSSRIKIHYAVNPSVGSGHTFSAGGGTQPYPAICVLTFSGVKTTSPFDVENGRGVFGTYLSPGSVTPNEDNEVLVVGATSDWANTYTVDNGFTLTNQLSITGGQYMGTVAAYKVQGTAAAVNPGFQGSNSTNAAVAIASFKAAVDGQPTQRRHGMHGQSFRPVEIGRQGSRFFRREESGLILPVQQPLMTRL